ncbi:hypothetical protein [Cupriavidus sp. 8B]
MIHLQAEYSEAVVVANDIVKRLGVPDAADANLGRFVDADRHYDILLTRDAPDPLGGGVVNGDGTLGYAHKEIAVLDLRANTGPYREGADVGLREGDNPRAVLGRLRNERASLVNGPPQDRSGSEKHGMRRLCIV